MHGRLKVKTTAQQEAEKQKERAIKQEKYLKAFNTILSKKEKLEHDVKGLYITGELLMANPDAFTLWNFRRIILLSLQKTSDDISWQKLLNDELKAIEMCLLKNPKSYGAWHHRDWVFRNIPQPDFDNELKLCDKYIEKDERNFHCWDHRCLIVKRSNRCLSKELQFTEELINKNFSNYSAWHYRSKLLPLLHPPDEGSSLPIAEKVFLKELDKVVTAVFTDPSDQSPWFFLRWLICKKETTTKIIQVGFLPLDNGIKNIYFIFSNKVLSCKELNVCINGEKIDQHDIKSSSSPYIWCLEYTSAQDPLCINISHKTWFNEVNINFTNCYEPSFKWISKEALCKNLVSDNAKKAFDRIIKDCVTLDELDPGNKWVLFTLVDMMSSVDAQKNCQNILSYLDQLQKIDFYRINYYKDIRNKLLMEIALMKYLKNESRSFKLTGQKITRIKLPHYLCSAETIDLGENQLQYITPIACFYNCKELILDANIVKDLKPIGCLKLLRVLSLRNCGIESLEPLKSLAQNLLLEELFLNDNIVTQINDFESICQSLIPSLTSIYC